MHVNVNKIVIFDGNGARPGAAAAAQSEKEHAEEKAAHDATREEHGKAVADLTDLRQKLAALQL
jgi:hypothetical protein